MCLGSAGVTSLRYVSKCGVLITVLTEVTKKLRKQLKQDPLCCPTVGRLTVHHAREGLAGGWEIVGHIMSSVHASGFLLL